MLENIIEKYQKTIDEWMQIISELNFSKHNEKVNFLVENYHLGKFQADLLVHKYQKSDSASIDEDTLIENQFKNKEHFLDLYKELIEFILGFGNDIEIVAKKNYISLRRKKQFLILQASSKTRFDISLFLKGESGNEVLIPIDTPNSMCSHKISISSSKIELTEEMKKYINQSYQLAK
jgi:predicted transport protein